MKNFFGSGSFGAFSFVSITMLGSAIPALGADQVIQANDGNYFSGGSLHSVTNNILNTDQDYLYQTERWAPSNLKVPVANGKYRVTLKFAELYFTSVGKRRFDVAIEGQKVLSAFDIYAAAGGRYVAVDRTFTATVQDGQLNVSLTRAGGDPSITAAVISAIDETPPNVSVTSHQDGGKFKSSASSVQLQGKCESGLLVKINGASVSCSNGAFSYLASVSGDSASFEVSQTDAAGNKGSKSLTLYRNKVPVAYAGKDLKTVLPDDSVTVTGTGQDADSLAGQLKFSWDQLIGSNVVHISDQQTFTVDGLKVGFHVYRVTVTDEMGESHSDKMGVSVVAPLDTTPPALAVTSPQDGGKFKSTASSVQLQGKCESGLAVIINGASVSCSNGAFSYQAPVSSGAASASFSLSQTDAAGNKASVSLVVNRNQVPVAYAGKDLKTVLPDDSVTVTGTAQDADSLAGQLKFSWDQLIGSSVVHISDQQTFTVDGLKVGFHVYRVTVTDEMGESHSDKMGVSVVAPEDTTPPVLAVTSHPDGGKFVSSATSVLLQGKCESGLAVIINGASISCSNGAFSYQAPVSSGAASASFALSQTDAAGNKASVSLTLNRNQVPVAYAGKDLKTVLPDDSVTVTGTAQDADSLAGQLKFRWDQLIGSSVVHISDQQSFSVDGLKEGFHVYRLTVTDEMGESHSDKMGVSVAPAPEDTTPPVLAVTSHSDGGKFVSSATSVLLQGKCESGLQVIINGASVSCSNGAFSYQAPVSSGAASASFALSQTDAAGLKTSVSLTLNRNQVPVAYAGKDLRIQLPENSVSLTGTAQDADSLPGQLKFQWDRLIGSSVVHLSDNEQTLTVGDLAQGFHVFRFTVTDEMGESHSDKTGVWVDAADPSDPVDPGDGDEVPGDDLPIADRPRIACTLTSSGGTCDHIIDNLSTAAPGYAVRTLISNPGWQPGERVCIKAGNYPYARLVIENVVGTASDPIEMINCGGRVVIGNSIDNDGDGVPDVSRGMELNGLKHVKVTGSGSPDYRYGIKLAGSSKGLSTMSFSGMSTDFEVEFIEVEKSGFSGIMAKTDPGCSDTNRTSFRGGFVQRNTSFHDNYIHDVVSGEGFYLGFSFYYGYTSNKNCAGTRLYSHPLENTRVYRNRIERIPSEAIQIGMGRNTEVFDNYIYGYGMSPFRVDQWHGIQIGGGTNGRFYNNYIDRGPSQTVDGNAVMIHATDDTYFVGNTVVGGAIYIHKDAGLKNDGTTSGVEIYIANNTVANHWSHKNNRGIINANVHAHKYIYNNLILLADSIVGLSLEEHIQMNALLDQTIPWIEHHTGAVGDTISESNNIRASITQDADTYFMSYDAKDFRLRPESDAVNAGRDVSAYGLKGSMVLDHANQRLYMAPRVVDGVIDIGSFEVQ